MESHLPKLKNENGEFLDDPRRAQRQQRFKHMTKRMSQGGEGQGNEVADDNNSNDEDDRNSDARIASRLQVRYADGELERLGIVNLEN